MYGAALAAARWISVKPVSSFCCNDGYFIPFPDLPIDGSVLSLVSSKPLSGKRVLSIVGLGRSGRIVSSVGAVLGAVVEAVGAVVAVAGAVVGIVWSFILQPQAQRESTSAATSKRLAIFFIFILLFCCFKASINRINEIRLVNIVTYFEKCK